MVGDYNVIEEFAIGSELVVSEERRVKFFASHLVVLWRIH